MTNLTEQLKKGQLEGFRWYYVKFKTGEIDICWLTEWSNDELGTCGQYFDGIEDENILEVLAPVPNFKEWLRLKEFADYSIHNRDELTRQINFWMKENTKLKELLKRVNKHFKWVDEDDPFYVKDELWDDIKQVLGEE